MQKLVLGQVIPDASDLVVGPIGVQNGTLVIVITPTGSATGTVVTADRVAQDLTPLQMHQAVTALSERRYTADISRLGDYQFVHQPVPGTGTQRFEVITGLPRATTEAQITTLFSVIAITTIGGLILLALSTAITIRLALRPLREVAATANRVANQPLDRGDVSITERVPPAEADPRTETGLVGAALNTLLDHVDASLAVRQRNEERMRQFVADASHELRTPLSSIRGYSELSLRALDRSGAEEDAATASAHTALERIQAQSLRMTSLVEDLLLLARLEEGRELTLSTVDLSRLAIEGVEDARPTALGPPLVDRRAAEPVEIIGDTGRLQQVVANLLANARTHTPAGTRIAIAVAEPDPRPYCGCATTAAASTRPCATSCSPASPAATAPAIVRPADPGSACRSRRRSWRVTAARSPCRASRDRPSSPCGCRAAHRGGAGIRPRTRARRREATSSATSVGGR